MEYKAEILENKLFNVNFNR